MPRDGIHQCMVPSSVIAAVQLHQLVHDTTQPVILCPPSQQPLSCCRCCDCPLPRPLLLLVCTLVARTKMTNSTFSGSTSGVGGSTCMAAQSDTVWVFLHLHQAAAHSWRALALPMQRAPHVAGVHWHGQGRYDTACCCPHPTLLVPVCYATACSCAHASNCHHAPGSSLPGQECSQRAPSGPSWHRPVIAHSTGFSASPRSARVVMSLAVPQPHLDAAAAASGPSREGHRPGEGAAGPAQLQ